jgi:hypothetical protein
MDSIKSNVYDSKETWATAVMKIFNSPESQFEESVLALYAKDCVITSSGRNLSPS